jgi:hypothetical protein
VKRYTIYLKQHYTKTIEADDLDSVKDWMSSVKSSDYNFLTEGHTIVDESTWDILEEVDA